MNKPMSDERLKDIKASIEGGYLIEDEARELIREVERMKDERKAVAWTKRDMETLTARAEKAEALNRQLKGDILKIHVVLGQQITQKEKAEADYKKLHEEWSVLAHQKFDVDWARAELADMTKMAVCSGGDGTNNYYRDLFEGQSADIKKLKARVAELERLVAQSNTALVSAYDMECRDVKCRRMSGQVNHAHCHTHQLITSAVVAARKAGE